jgi:sigma-B regulation protein RsbU (phosphoserine phosphatase)
MTPTRPTALSGGPDLSLPRGGVTEGLSGAADPPAEARALQGVPPIDLATEIARRDAEIEELKGRLDAMSRRMAEDLRLAISVQRGVLPPALHHPGLELAREFIPLREIGGDYYDLVPLGPDRIAFAIGDVMGKGVAAALIAANLKASFRAQMQDGAVAVHEAVARMNRLFWEATPRGLFATFFVGIFDLARGTLEYVNAGHDYPFVVKPDGGVFDLAAGGTVLGLLEEARYERGEVQVQVDDLVVFYSDGLTDRTNAEGEIYGIERLKEAALRSRSDNARIALYSLLGEAQGWSSGSPPEDDLTLVVAKLV